MPKISIILLSFDFTPKGAYSLHQHYQWLHHQKVKKFFKSLSKVEQKLFLNQISIKINQLKPRCQGHINRTASYQVKILWCQIKIIFRGISILSSSESIFKLVFSFITSNQVGHFVSLIGSCSIKFRIGIISLLNRF